MEEELVLEFEFINEFEIEDVKIKDTKLQKFSKEDTSIEKELNSIFKSKKRQVRNKKTEVQKLMDKKKKIDQEKLGSARLRIQKNLKNLGKKKTLGMNPRALHVSIQKKGLSV